MSREIKFRQWTNSHMVEWDQFCIEARSLNLIDGLMQFTGLTDKNGVEIYEGDIVKEAHLIGVVKFDSEDLTWRFHHALGRAGFFGFTGEVIGNIYETPELLEGKE